MATLIIKHAKAFRGLLLLLTSVTLVFVGFSIAGVDEVLHSFQQFPAWVVPAVLIVFALNLIVVSFRLGRLLSYFGINHPFNVVFQASVQGHFAALFLMSLFGQIAGRHMILRHYGIPPVFIATLTVFERAMLLLVSGGLCMFGAAWLLDSGEISAFLVTTSFTQFFLVASLSLLIALWFGHSRFEVQLLTRLRSKEGIGNLVEVGWVTFLAQGLILSAFVVAGLGLAPDASVIDLIAVAAIISFAAGLPISVNGWGVRELAAIFAFSKIGVSSSSALAVSILVGLCSTAIVLAVFPFACSKGKGEVKKKETQTELPAALLIQTGYLPIEKVGAWVLLIASTTLIFFQLHIPLFSGVININVADACALIALVAVVTHSIHIRSLPEWRVPGFNKILLVYSGLILFAFVHGAGEIGVTQWAFAGRVVGWLVLLGYLSVGVLGVTYFGRRGVRRFLDTFIITACTVVISQAIIRWIPQLSGVDVGYIPVNFEGYAGNRNAFAFQMLVCSVMLIAYSSYHRKIDSHKGLLFPSASHDLGISRERLFALFHGIILAGLAFSESRAGMVSGIILLTTAALSGFMRRRTLLMSVIFAVVVWSVFNGVLPWISHLSSDSLNRSDNVQSVVSYQSSDPENSGAMQSGIQIENDNSFFQRMKSQESSDHERWRTIQRGMQLWMDDPLFGAGIGVFFEKSSQWFKRPTVIHSTPVWILAEFGLVGAIIFYVGGVRILFRACRKGCNAPQDRAIVLLFGVFVVFSVVHEIFYQRIFWLVLGVCLAMPFRDDPSCKTS